jgi:hypothetical protein
MREQLRSKRKEKRGMNKSVKSRMTSNRDLNRKRNVRSKKKRTRWLIKQGRRSR